MNSLAGLDSKPKSLALEASGYMVSNFVMASWVAELSLADLRPSSKLKGAARRSLPVTLPYSCQPLLRVSSALSSPSRGPEPTRVQYDLNTKIISSTLFGPMPTSEQIPEALTSLLVTKG